MSGNQQRFSSNNGMRSGYEGNNQDWNRRQNGYGDRYGEDWNQKNREEHRRREERAVERRPEGSRGDFHNQLNWNRKQFRHEKEGHQKPVLQENRMNTQRNSRRISEYEARFPPRQEIWRILDAQLNQKTAERNASLQREDGSDQSNEVLRRDNGGNRFHHGQEPARHREETRRGWNIEKRDGYNSVGNYKEQQHFSDQCATNQGNRQQPTRQDNNYRAEGWRQGHKMNQCWKQENEEHHRHAYDQGRPNHREESRREWNKENGDYYNKNQDWSQENGGNRFHHGQEPASHREESRRNWNVEKRDGYISVGNYKNQQRCSDYFGSNERKRLQPSHREEFRREWNKENRDYFEKNHGNDYHRSDNNHWQREEKENRERRQFFDRQNGQETSRQGNRIEDWNRLHQNNYDDSRNLNHGTQGVNDFERTSNNHRYYNDEQGLMNNEHREVESRFQNDSPREQEAQWEQPGSHQQQHFWDRSDRSEQSHTREEVGEANKWEQNEYMNEEESWNEGYDCDSQKQTGEQPMYMSNNEQDSEIQNQSSEPPQETHAWKLPEQNLLRNRFIIGFNWSQHEDQIDNLEEAMERNVRQIIEAGKKDLQYLKIMEEKKEWKASHRRRQSENETQRKFVQKHEKTASEEFVSESSKNEERKKFDPTEDDVLRAFAASMKRISIEKKGQSCKTVEEKVEMAVDEEDKENENPEEVFVIGELKIKEKEC